MTASKNRRNDRRNHPRAFRLVLMLAALLVCLAGCKTSRRGESGFSKESTCLSSKVKLTVPSKQSVLTVNGTLKLVRGERMQISFLMPILRTEVARIEVTPDDLLLVDRMGKRYVHATRKELKDVLPRKATFAHLEKLNGDYGRTTGHSLYRRRENRVLGLLYTAHRTDTHHALVQIPGSGVV